MSRDKPIHFTDSDKRFLWREIQTLDALVRAQGDKLRRLEDQVRELNLPHTGALHPQGNNIPVKPPPGLPAVSLDGDEPSHQATQEVAGGLQPDPFYIKHAGFGRYQVIRSADETPVYARNKRWLNKDEAAAVLMELVDGE